MRIYRILRETACASVIGGELAEGKSLVQKIISFAMRVGAGCHETRCKLWRRNLYYFELLISQLRSVICKKTQLRRYIQVLSLFIINFVIKKSSRR